MKIIALALWFTFIVSGCTSQPSPEQIARVKQMREHVTTGAKADINQRAALEFPEVTSAIKQARSTGRTIVPPSALQGSPIGFISTGKVRSVKAPRNVWIAFVIGEDGRVAEYRLLSEDGTEPDPVLFDIAGDAVKNWRFSPATLEGRPIRYVLSLPMLIGA